ncbi:MAG TPA: DinB family protein [Acidobacteriaceae bacterium]
MSVGDELLTEFQEELVATRRILDRVPTDKLTWKPHEKSMSLGQLAMHIARVPGGIVRITSTDSFDVLQGNFTPPLPETTAEIHAALDESARTVETTLRQAEDAWAQAPWRLMAGDRELHTRQRCKVWRTLLLNHWYHHRGQLTVYLRLLGIPVPVIYGSSADESAVS